MTTSTPVLGLVLYDASTDTSVSFATSRATLMGPATSSNLYKIDTAIGTLQTNVTALQSARGSIPVSASYISANYYEATVSAITAYTTGMTIILSVDTTSNGTVTLQINALGIKSLMKVNSSGTAINLTGSDLVKGRQYLFEYDGTRFLWVSANSADQIQIVGTSGNIVTVGSSNNLDGSTTPATLVAATINSATAKTTPHDNDTVGIVDSEASNVLKKLSWTNIKATLKTYFDTLYKSGRILQDLTAVNTTYSTITTAMPFDDTIPQISEGGQILSQAITPTASGNKIKVCAVVYLCSDPPTTSIAALFDGNTSAVRAAFYALDSANRVVPLVLEYEFTSSGTSPITFTVRGGNNTGSSTYVNGRSGGRVLGGVVACTLNIQEISA